MEREKAVLGRRRHSRYALLYYVLKACLKPKSLAQIFWSKSQVFSYKTLKELTDIALRLKLLKVEERKFITTEKGKVYIRKFEELVRLLESD
jgi:predicted transcriptional regulator